MSGDGPASRGRRRAPEARLALRVTPGARTTGWAGQAPDGRRRLRVAEPALEGRANRATVAFVAGALGIPRRAVRLERGTLSRDKVLLVELTAEELTRRLARLDEAAAGRTPEAE